jgi:phosphohistidine phosphatase
MRHAKAEMAELLQQDFDRNLSDKGMHDAKEMGSRLLQKNIGIDLIVCSAAKRTHKTAKLVASVIGYNPEHILREYDLYESDSNEMLHVIRSFDDKYNTVLLVAHNPTITGMVGLLTASFADNMSTAAQAHITFNIPTWKLVANGIGSLTWVDSPKNM